MPAEDARKLQRRLRTAFVILVAVGPVFVIWTAEDFRRAARLFPFMPAGSRWACA